MKLILKGCPRCGGDLMPDRWDLEGDDMCCAQCGYTASLARLLRPAATLTAVPNYVPVVAERRVA